MGNGDFSCFIHGGEGDQDLGQHEFCCSMTTGDEEHEDQSCGPEYAILVSYHFRSSLSTEDRVLEAIQNLEFFSFEVIRSEYCCQEQEFSDPKGYSEKRVDRNHRYHSSLWSPPKSAGQQWILNICPLCWSQIFLQPVKKPLSDDRHICPYWIKQVLEKHQQIDLPVDCRSRLAKTEHFRTYFRTNYLYF